MRRPGRGMVPVILLAATAVVAAAPLFLDPAKDWLQTGLPRWGALLAVVTLVVYFFLARSGAALRPGLGGFRLRTLDAVLLLALPFYALSTANGRILTTGDSQTTRRLGPLLVTTGMLDLSNVPGYGESPLHYSAIRVRDRILPSFPIGTGLLSVPYAATSLLLSGGRVTPQLLDRSEKHLAALLMAASVVLLFLGIRRRFGEGPALGASAVFAVATPTLTTASQALWSFTGETFFLCLALFFVLPREVSDARAATGGLAMAAAFLCRPTALIPAACVGLALLFTHRRVALVYATAAAAGCSAAALFLFRLYGHPLGGYALLNPTSTSWAKRPAVGFLGNLISPSRGLLVFFPYLLTLPLVRPALSRDRELARWFWASLGAVAGVYLLASIYRNWWGGYSLGPRLMTEASPFLALLTVPFWSAASGRRSGRAVAVATISLAAATQILSLYREGAWSWNWEARVDTDRQALWTLRRSQLLAIWWPQALATARERTDILGTCREDALLTGGLDDLPKTGIIQGPLVVRGWARIPGEDLEVRVLLDNTERVSSPAVRYSRPDVCSALPLLVDCTKAGFEVRFDFEKGDEGQHEITAIFFSRDGRCRIYPPTLIRWKP